MTKQDLATAALLHMLYGQLSDACIKHADRTVAERRSGFRSAGAGQTPAEAFQTPGPVRSRATMTAQRLICSKSR